MQLRSNKLNKVVIKANTKQEIIDQLHLKGLEVDSNEIGSVINCYVGPDGCGGFDVFPVNFNKFRSKRGGEKAHWVAYVYCLNTTTLADLGIKIVQHPRYFTISNFED